MPTDKMLLARRLQRIQDATDRTSQAMAAWLGIKYRTYQNALYGLNAPRGMGRAALDKAITEEETRLELSPLTEGSQTK